LKFFDHLGARISAVTDLGAELAEFEVGDVALFLSVEVVENL